MTFIHTTVLVSVKQITLVQTVLHLSVWRGFTAMQKAFAYISQSPVFYKTCNRFTEKADDKSQGEKM